jgi:hypothetical protein
VITVPEVIVVTALPLLVMVRVVVVAVCAEAGMARTEQLRSRHFAALLRAICKLLEDSRNL